MVKNFKKKGNVFKGESNPFNMKINREKRCVLGQNTQGTKGLRGISRAECYAKRKNLWQKTKVIAQKANKFTDKRLMDGSEESSINRLVQERKKKLKKNIYNLNEESLTHNGMPLDVTKPARGGRESDSDEEEQLDATFVNKAHFGGPSDLKSNDPKSQKEILEELIVESKKKKYEKKMEKEQTDDMTESLDEGWKDFLSVVGKIKCMEPKSGFEKPDPYTVLTNQLKFEKRGNPTGRTKTAEELELEEKERLRKLEVERLARMNDDAGKKSKKADDHISADSILDDFELEPILENADEKPDAQGESDYSDSEEEDESSEEEEEDVEMEAEVEDPGNDESDDLDRNLSKIPSKIADFEEKTRDFNPEKVGKAVEVILKPYLKAKSEKILKKLAAFFGVLVEYALKNLGTNITISGEIVPHLHTIAEISPLDTAEVFLKYLDQEQQAYQESKKLKKKKGFPSLQSILILKYCSVLYSVSDYRHSVVTPAFIFMCDILSSAFPATLSNIASRLFVCSIIVDCVSLSKRFVPDAISFLNETLRLALPSQTKTTPKQKRLQEINLVLHNEPTCNKVANLDIFNLDKSVVDDTMKQSIIFKTVGLLHEFATLYTHLPSYPEIFSDTLSICSKLPTCDYPDILKDSINKLTEEITSIKPTLRHLTYQNTKPKPLVMFEPSFESKFDKKESVNIKKQFEQLKQVSKKIKREEKSVLRDMRRDAEMIATEKLKERLESDAERKRKVKELYHDLATQEGEYKKMMKKKS